jgi:3-phosphoshikimate 1-carboxyvinyltransferase
VTEARLVEPLARPPDATVAVPGSKSYTNRALVCAALATGTSLLDGALVADDTAAMIECLRALGIDADQRGTVVTVHGCGGAVPATDARLDARLSGTTARFIAPVAALGPGRYRIDGGAPLRTRPMNGVIDGLRQLDVDVIEEGAPGHLPIVVAGGGAPGGHVELTGDTSSQFLSGLLLSGPAWRDGLRVELTTDLVSRPYVDMTVAVMRAFGGDVDANDTRFEVSPTGYGARDYHIEPDASAAAYFFAAAAISGGRVTVDGLGPQSRQGDLRFVDVLEAMGATVTRADASTTVVGPSALRGVTVDLRDLSDTVPTLAATAVFAAGPTTITGVGFIRGKETDRIASVVTELRRCGIDAHEHADGLTVVPGVVRPARIETYDDHRMAMAFALIGLGAPGIEIADPGCVAKTFPGYFEALDQLR